MNVYAYNAEMLCQGCGESTCELLEAYVSESERDNSDSWPQGPTPDGGGEADYPQHCSKCKEFLQNPLTNEGVVYVLEVLAQDEEDLDEVQANTRQEWAEFYDLGPEETAVWAINEAEADS